MKKYLNKLVLIGTVFPSLLYATSSMQHDTLEDILDQNIELKANIGSREEAKNYLDSSNAVDVITMKQIKNSGQTKLTDLLKYYIAGFNAIESSISDGSDHITGYSLRGMSSDQILVLINGKRLHTSAMVHEVGVISRGTSHVDLNTIPLIAIEKIEVLRDAAAAQYGTDAISGIINIKLKEKSSNLLELHTGRREAGDGQVYQVDAFSSTELKYDGFLNVSLSAKQQHATQRAGKDTRLDTPEVHTRVGLPEAKHILSTLNSEIVLESDTILYSNILLSYKESISSAFLRTPDPTRPIYPDGFLPLINAKILDSSVAFGIKDNFNDFFSWDLSNVYGYNHFNYNLQDSINSSLGASSPTSFDAGGLTFTQNTTNLDLKKRVNNITLTGGLEYRYENYKIHEGDEASYTGTGSEGFAGFSKANNTDIDRDVYAVYADMVHRLNKIFSYELAARYENYSDFGSTANYKLSLGYKVLSKLLLRSSASSGFRAPSLSQSGYTHTSSFATDSGLALSGIFEPSDAISKSLGAQKLRPENSLHYTLGAVYQFNKKISFMVDYFYTKVDDRILLSDKKNLPSNSYGVASASYFTNAINTQTQGVDVKLDYELDFRDDSHLKSIFWYHYNDTKIRSFNENVSYSQTQRIEHAQPKTAIRLLNNYKKDDYEFTLNISRFGSYYHVLGDNAYKFGENTTVDLDINYRLNSGAALSLGATNIFSEMPDKWDGRSNPYLGYDGILQYSNNSPIGYSGAYYYLKVSYDF